jgi:hypothetical protein
LVSVICLGEKEEQVEGRQEECQRERGFAFWGLRCAIILVTSDRVKNNDPGTMDKVKNMCPIITDAHLDRQI